MESCETEINDLPNELIIKIMRFLDHHDLQKAVLTCKFWKYIIESSCLWPLKVSRASIYSLSKNNPQYNFIAITERKFRSIELTGSLLFRGAVSAVMDIVQRHGLNIVKLRLVDIQLDKLAVLVQILNCLPNLNELIIFRTETSDNYLRNTVNLPLLPKLETLHIVGSEYRILNCLKKAKVKTLKVINSNFGYSFNSYPLEFFLKSQDRLTTLVLRSLYNSDMMPFWTAHPNDPMPFQLTRLSLLTMKLAENHYSNLITFIDKHSHSLKELELVNQFHHTIYECVFGKMTNLETLYLVIDKMPQNAQDLGQLENNSNIQNVIIRQANLDTCWSVPFFRHFFKHLPNVTTLTILMKCPKAIMKVVADNLTHLKVLKVSEYGANFHDMHFPNLNALHIDVLNGKVNWQIFSRAYPKLTEFTIEMLKNMNGSVDVSGEHENDPNLEEIAKMTKANVHLHTLRFGKWLRADARYLEVLRMNCPTLKALELHKNSAALNEPYDQSWVGVIRFCENSFKLCQLQAPIWRVGDEDF